MIERRPHWDDDLIDAVSSSINRYVGAEELNRSLVYAVIAAVEDWQDANGLGRIGLLLGQRQSAINERIEAEAAIQRVRELHRHRMGSRYYVCAECGDNVSYPCATRRLVDNDPWGFLHALDGGAE